MVTGLILPERLAGSFENLIGFSSAVTLDHFSDLFHLDKGSQQSVDVICHDDPGVEIVFLQTRSPNSRVSETDAATAGCLSHKGPESPSSIFLSPVTKRCRSVGRLSACPTSLGIDP